MKLPTQKSTAILSAIHSHGSPSNDSKKKITLASKVTPPGPGAYEN